MLNLTDSEKECFYKSGAYFNDYEFNFPDLDYTITNGRVLIMPQREKKLKHGTGG